jgi:hypothetical protein
VVKGGGRGKGAEMTQILYVHMNKIFKKDFSLINNVGRNILVCISAHFCHLLP